jgi:hypothetical protein
MKTLMRRYRPALRLVYAATISPAMALDNPQLRTQIEAGRQALGHGWAGHEQY